MNVLIDIVHPADVLFFLNPIRKLQQQGHRVCVASRKKDVALELLDAFEIEHHPISRAGSGIIGLGLELVKRDFALFKLARSFRPDVMCGFGGIAISHVGKVVDVPSLSFYDTERAPLQHKITLPFISYMYVPESYEGPIARNRTARFPGTKEFSYLHPENFTPDEAIARAAGLDANSDNIFIRLVGWAANHDFGYQGWEENTLRQLVQHLSGHAKVHISSEIDLPPDLEAHRYRGPIHAVHHLLAFCDYFIGESATMASEAVLLGTPAIYATNDKRCYTDELASQGLIWKVLQVDFDTLCLATEKIAGLDTHEWQTRVDNYRFSKPNLANYVVNAILLHGKAEPGTNVT